MKEISGFVVRQETTRETRLYGPLTDGAGVSWIDVNGLKFFPSAEAAAAANEIKAKRRREKLGIRLLGTVCRLELAIAQSEEDLVVLQNRGGRYIVIFGSAEIVYLLGEYRPGGIQMFDSGGFLSQKVLPFVDFAAARRLASEAARQGQDVARVARIEIQPIEKSG